MSNFIGLLAPRNVDQRLAALGGHLAARIREERLRRQLSQRELAVRSGVSKSLVCWIEAGRLASFATYARLSEALGLRLEMDIVDHRRSKGLVRKEDPVHAGMTEWFARRLGGNGFALSLDEPYQHYQFAGRADIVAWTLDPPALLHIENRTQFPNIQEAIGSYNAKRRYLPAAMADRLGARDGFTSVTNVMAVLWSAEALHDLRLRSATFAATCADPVAHLEAWLSGSPPSATRSTSTLVVIDPTATGRSRSLIGLVDVSTARPRFRGYADALTGFRRAGLC